MRKKRHRCWTNQLLLHHKSRPGMWPPIQPTAHINLQIPPTLNHKQHTTTTTTSKLIHHIINRNRKIASFTATSPCWLPNKPKGNTNHNTQNKYSNSSNVPKSPFNNNQNVPPATDLTQIQVKIQMPICPNHTSILKFLQRRILNHTQLRLPQTNSHTTITIQTREITSFTTTNPCLVTPEIKRKPTSENTKPLKHVPKYPLTRIKDVPTTVDLIQIPVKNPDAKLRKGSYHIPNQ